MPGQLRHLSQLAEEGADFTELARKHSQHPSARNGGRIGLLFRRQLTPPLREALAGAAAGSVVGPVAAAEGFSLLLVEELAPAQLDTATTGVLTRELFAAWLAERLASAPFTAPLLDALTGLHPTHEPNSASSS